MHIPRENGLRLGRLLGAPSGISYTVQVIHFFPIFSANPDNTPFGAELRRSGAPYRLFGERIRFHYSRRIFILLVGYPRLLWFGLRSAWRSMVRSRPRPRTVVVWSDVEVLVFAAVRFLLPWRGPSIVLPGFIYTERTHPALNRLRQTYFAFVLGRCGCVICHSRLELARYQALFPRAAGRFAFVPWGGNVEGHDEPTPPDTAPHPFRVLAAGRSGRDYPTLAAATRDAALELTVVCDNREALGGIEEGGNLRILRACYEIDYLAELRRADVVVVPLAVADISAGQMVIIQAMAMRKPLVVTRTPTVLEYMADDVEGILVPRGDTDAVRSALARLQADPGLRSRLGEAGRTAYLARFSQGAYVRHMLAAIERSMTQCDT